MTRRSIRSDERRRPADRRPGLIPGRRFALLLACAFAALGWQAAAAAADPSSDEVVSATVYSASGTTQNDSVSLAQLQSNPNCTTYSGTDMNELGRTGFVDVQLAPSDTWALSTILGCLTTPVPIAAVRGVTVIDGQGAPEEGSGSMLTPADLAPQGSTDFNNSQQAPVVQALGSVNQYDRPWRGSQADQDFLDEVQNSENDQPLPIAIEVFEGPVLTVTVSASQTTVPVGKSVTFNATVTGQNGSPLSYSWNFDGGAQSSTASSPQVAFGNTGQYDVTVQVTDSSGGGGGAQIPITVGTPAAPTTGRHKQTGAGTNKKSHAPGGPRKSKGTHPGGAAGKSTGGKSTTNGKGNTSAGKNTSTTSTTTTSTTPPSTTPASTTPSSTAGTSTHHTATPQRTATSRSLGGHATVPPARPTPPPPTPGPLISGQLVSDVTPLAVGVSPLIRVVPVAVATAPPARQAIRSSLLPAFGAGFAVLLLLGLGAGRELRGRRRGPTLHVGS